jgi:hypothetical protein
MPDQSRLTGRLSLHLAVALLGFSGIIAKCVAASPLAVTCSSSLIAADVLGFLTFAANLLPSASPKS